MITTMTNGYASFKEWVDAGYPGAKSFPKEEPVLTDKRRGLCTAPDCDNTVGGLGNYALQLCGKHMEVLRRERQAAREASRSA